MKEVSWSKYRKFLSKLYGYDNKLLGGTSMFNNKHLLLPTISYSTNEFASRSIYIMFYDFMLDRVVNKEQKEGTESLGITNYMKILDIPEKYAEIDVGDKLRFELSTLTSDLIKRSPDYKDLIKKVSNEIDSMLYDKYTQKKETRTNIWPLISNLDYWIANMIARKINNPN